MHQGWRKFWKLSLLKWLKIHFNHPPWLEKILEIKSSEMAKNAL